MVRFVAKVSNEAQIAPGDPVMGFVTCLNASKLVAQRQHWQTKSRSDHQALQYFYENIPPLLDGFVESFQGVFGKLTEYIYDYPLSADEPVPYFTALYSEVQTLRRQERFPQETWLQNQVDEIAALIASTLYQLKELK